jgi:hypothetical protein
VIISWEERLFFSWKTCHHGPMRKSRHLRDVYRFPGFEPLPAVRGIFGDPRAVVVTLQRQEKKRLAAAVGKCRRRSTINDHAVSAIFRVATNVSISTSSSGGWIARGVAP